MSIKSLLMPVISQRLLSRERLLRRREQAERRRVARGDPHTLLYFHQTDDPYSALAAQVLPRLLSRYPLLRLQAHVVGPPGDHAAPARAQLVAYSRCDAQRLAQRWGLDFADPGRQPDAAASVAARDRLIAASADGRFAELAGGLSRALWQGAASGKNMPAPHAGLLGDLAHDAEAQVARSEALRQRLGHYLGATFHYGGEWYWGVDRLYHLEQRLQDLRVRASGVSGALFPPSADPEPGSVLETPRADAPPTIDFFVSLRSPYSAIAAPRVFNLARATGARVRIRYVLPMVMRGLPVPRTKRAYISLDAAREAHARGIPFGRINDPLGRPTERGLALMPLAERLDRTEAYLLSFMHGVWAEGLDAGSTRGLRTIAERAGLRWADAEAALHDEAWRAVAEHNRAEMSALGLWGVPSFRVGELAVWGQDRLWAVQEAVLHAQRSEECTA